MSDRRCNSNCDPVEQEARQLTRMLDSGAETREVAAALREDSYNMSPANFNRMVNQMMRNERKNCGDDLYQDRDGNLIIDGRRGQEFVVATRDFDVRQQAAREQHGHRQYGHHDRRGNDRDAVTDGVVNGAIGAVIGGAIDGKKGAIAGGAAGVGNVIVDRAGGRNNRDDVTDVVVKGAIGAGIGAVIDGGKGAKAGAAGSVGASIIDKLFNKHER